MHPGDCPGWEYKNHANYGFLPARCKAILVAQRNGGINVDKAVHDTRPHHREMFTGITPDKCEYFAGAYRGENFRCLRYYEVRISSDPRVGVPPEFVLSDLSNLSVHIIRAGFAALDVAFKIPHARLSPGDKLYFLVSFACHVLVEFLRIHPYANGNGHMGRFIVWMIISKFGYWPARWPLNQSPPYHKLISDYRDGVCQPLEEFVLKSVTG